MEKIILASSSPRRRELLELIGVPFIVHPSKADETIEEELTPSQVVEQLAMRKAKDISSHYKEGLIIGADTIVVFDGEILGKPENEDDAFRMLKFLQGNQHEVYSGVAIISSETGELKKSYHMTKVFMSPLTDDEIRAYISTGEPMNKAGSYGIQGIGALFIDKIEGDYFNVVGLPLSLLSKLLNLFGIHVIKDILHPKSNV